MNLQRFMALDSHSLLVATHSGSVQGVIYAEGTVGVIERIGDPSEGSGRIIRFTQNLAFDLTYLNWQRNWEVLKHCAACSRSTVEVELCACAICLRPDYCPTCITSHVCLVPDIGVSRKPRHNRLTKGK